MVGKPVAVVASFAAAALVALSAPLPASAGTGAASTQLDSLAAKLAASAGHIHQLTQAYGQASLTVSTLGQAVAADNASLAALRGRLDASQEALRRQAVISYTGASATGMSTGAPAGAAPDPSVRAEYLRVITGDVGDSIDSYRAQAQQLASDESRLRQEEAASQQAAAAEGADRAQALAAASALQASLDQLQAQLRQRAAAEQAAQAARRAAQGYPVNGGLVAAVNAVVSPQPASSAGGAGGVWLRLRGCESGNTYQADTGNGFYGVYQFSPQTWANLGLPGRPDQEPPAMQDAAAQELQQQSGWGQWPACSAALGLS
ncbi:MAG: transglycosylase family protein [Acidimicrobiales bacterium]